MWCSTVVIVLLAVASGHAKKPSQIVGGRAVGVNEHNFIITLNIDGKHVCGGSIIGSKYVLTAAHCVANLFDLSRVRIFTGTKYSTGGGSSFGVRAIKYHRNYNPSDTASPNDIAVIELDRFIPFNGRQNKIALRSAPVPNGSYATAIGWGFRSHHHPVITTMLMQVDLTTVDASVCQKYLPYRLYTHQICTTSPQGRGVCMGDSGGPLIHNNELIGVVSYGIPCAVGKPDVFTSVYHYLPWIRQIIRE